MVIPPGLLNFIRIIACIEDPIFLFVSAVCLSFHAVVRKPACIGFSPNRTLWKVLIIEDSGLNQNPKMTIVVLEQEHFINVVATPPILPH